MDWPNLKPGDLVWFESGIGFPLPGEIQEFHKAGKNLTLPLSLDLIFKTVSALSVIYFSLSIPFSAQIIIVHALVDGQVTNFYYQFL